MDPSKKVGATKDAANPGLEVAIVGRGAEGLKHLKTVHVAFLIFASACL